MRDDPSTVPAVSAALAQHLAHEAGLVYVTDRMPGFARVRRGARFAYLDAQRRPVRDPGVLARIARLAIPPAYEDVWICANARGHLQATGRDARRVPHVVHQSRGVRGLARRVAQSSARGGRRAGPEAAGD